MSRNSVCIFLFAALFMIAHGSQFQRFALDQGKTSFRSLDTAAAATIEHNPLVNYTLNQAVRAHLGDEYLANNNMTSANQTDMLVFLYTSTTGFCYSCGHFKNYNCTSYNNYCNYDTTGASQRNFKSPYYQISTAYPFNKTMSIGNSTNSLWQLSTPAYYFTSASHYSIYKNGANRNYITDYNTYGFIGLGVDGDAAKNFKGEHPLFSVQINTTGQGQLILGKDSTLFDSARTPTILTADANWTMTTQSMTFGPNISVGAYNTKLVFDLQHSGIAISDKHWDANLPNTTTYMNTMLRNQYKLENSGANSSEEYRYSYTGNLSDLPDLVFNLTENNMLLTIPPSAYTRNIFNNTYVILIERINSPDSNEYTVLGWPVLSAFYTVFEQQKGGKPTITLNPTYAAANVVQPTSTGTSFLGRLFQIAVIAVILAVVYMFFKNKAAAKLKTELGVELRDGQPY